MPATDEPDVPPAAGWEPCPPGEIARLGRKLRGRKSRRTFLRTAAATAATALTAGGVIAVIVGRQNKEYDYGGIVCSEVVPLAPAYLAGDVPEPTRSKVATHIALCPNCGPYYQKLRTERDRAG